MAYNEYVIDEFNRKYDRKNQYILDLINASSKEEIKKIENNRENHPYIIKLNKYEKDKKALIEESKKEAEENISKGSDDKKIYELKKRLYIAEKNIDFFKSNYDLTYDAVLNRDIHEHEIRHIPDIIEYENNLQESLREKTKQLENLDSEIKEKQKQEVEKVVKEINKDLEEDLAHTEKIYKEGLINKESYKNQKRKKKKAAEDKINNAQYINQEKSLKEDIENIKHRLKFDIETKINLLESDISDVRRRTPIEIEKKRPIISKTTFLLPGLGQLLNGQKMKALFFFLISLFTYLIAIPYALGFGNYQGEGIHGLITLAEGGAKLDKSIIFMIEGIISIILLILAVLFTYISYKDVNTVEKNEIKGIRKKTWFETKDTLSRDGFPYLVSSPALLVVIFIVMIPIITTFLISFTNMSPDHQNKFNWVGLDNYATIAKGQGLAGSIFWTILGWTVIWTIGASTLAIVIGFIMALLLNQDRIKGKGFFRTIYLLPWAVPAFITIMFFSLMLAKNGPFTQVLNGIFNTTLDIKNNQNLTRLFLILIQGWLGSAYIFLLTTGVLQGISDELYEAAEIDGATGWQKTRYITIPLVLFQVAPLLISQYTQNFNNFTIIYLFNGGGPFNPSVYGNLAGASDILISYIYKLTIENQYQGIGAAITMLISVVVMIITFFGYRNTAAFKED